MEKTYHYKLAFDEIEIDKETIIKTIGYPENKAPVQVIKIIDDTIKESEGCCIIEGGYRILENIAIDIYRF